MSDKKNNSDMPALSDRDIQLLVYALRSAEGGFPKVGRIPPLCDLHP